LYAKIYCHKNFINAKLFLTAFLTFAVITVAIASIITVADAVAHAVISKATIIVTHTIAILELALTSHK